MSNKLRFKSLILIAIILFMLIFGISSAALFKSGERVVVQAGQTIADSLYAFGEYIEINGTIDGDVIAAGQTIIIKGKVLGDINVAGQEVQIFGECEDLRVAGKSIRLKADIKRDVLALGYRLDSMASNKVGSTLWFAGKEASIAGYVGKDLIISADDVYISNAVQIVGKRKINIEDVLKRSEAMKEKFRFKLGGRVLSLYVFVLMNILFLIINSFFPNMLRQVVNNMKKQTLKSLGVAVLFFILLPVIFFILGLSVIGLPLIPLIIVAVIFFTFLYKVFASVFIGHAFLEWLAKLQQSRRPKKQVQKPSTYFEFLVGLIAIYFLGLIPVLGTLFKCLLFMLTFGASILRKIDFYKSARRAKLL